MGIRISKFAWHWLLLAMFSASTIASQSPPLVYSSGTSDVDAMVRERLSETAKSKLDFGTFRAAVTKAIEDLHSVSGVASATYGVNLLTFLAQQPHWPRHERIQLARYCLKRAFENVENVSVEAEIAVLRSIEGDTEFAVPLSPISDDGGDQRKLRTEWWLHAWTRYADAINSPDLVSPGPRIVIPQVAPMTVTEEDARKQRSERQELIRKRDELHLRSIDFARIKSDAEQSIVTAYATPPYDFDQLLNVLDRNFGSRHPQTRKFLEALAEALPADRKPELERILRALPPPAALEDIAASRSVLGNRRTQSRGEQPTVLPERQGRQSKVLADIREASAKALTAQTAKRGKDDSLDGAQKARAWFAVALSFFAGLAFLVWRSMSLKRPSK